MSKKVAIVFVSSPLGELWQDKIVLRSGVSKTRNFRGISETLEGDESPLDAALRGLQEELGVYIPALRLIPGESRRQIKPSNTTGLLTQYEFSEFSIRLLYEECQFPLVKEEGKGTLYLKWR